MNPDHTAALGYDDGNGREIFSKVVKFMDFPMDLILLGYTNSAILVPRVLSQSTLHRQSRAGC